MLQRYGRMARVIIISIIFLVYGLRRSTNIKFNRLGYLNSADPASKLSSRQCTDDGDI